MAAAAAEAAPPKKSSAPKQVRLLPSLFPHRKPVVFFEYPAFLKESRHRPRKLRLLPSNSRRKLFYRIWAVHNYNCVRNSLERAGFRPTEGDNWNAAWTKHLPADHIARLNPYQKCNHWPGSWGLGRKDRLSRNVDALVRRNGERCRIAPQTFWLPGERGKLRAEMEARPRTIWIFKPPALSCGKGITLGCPAAAGGVSKALPPPDRQLVAQRYLSKPLLVGGRKFDLRLYVLVTSFDPPRIYFFRDGLARFATSQYNASVKPGSRALADRHAHLTNYSVNKKSANFVKNTTADQDDQGSKWSLLALLRHLRSTGVDTLALTRRIHDLIIKTLFAVEPDLGSIASRCFRPDPRETAAGSQCMELFGFDVLVDAALRPWLIEVNVSPSLSSSSPMDRAIKNRLLTDAFHLAGFAGRAL